MRDAVSKTRAYRFQDLLCLSNDESAPPLVFIHVPKTAGSTLNSILMKNYKFRADSRAENFLDRWWPAEIERLGGPPRSEDDRARPAFFTGDIDLGNDIFRHLPGRYLAITLLREPVSRIISHFRFNSTQPSAIQAAIFDQKMDVVEYLRRGIRQQYEIFAPTNASAESDRVAEALGNLENCLSLFGVQEEFDRFMEALVAMIGLRDVTYRRLNKTPAGASEVTAHQEDALRELLRFDTAFYEGARRLYLERMAMLDAKVKQEPHPWSRFYA
jgi:Sulfotransferase family